MIDRIIKILNEESEKSLGFKVKAKYATPSDYFKKISNEPDLPSLYNSDFSHYDEHFHLLHPDFEGRDRIDYWTGYYSNRPGLKSLIYRSFHHFHLSETFANLAQLHSYRPSPPFPTSSNRTRARCRSAVAGASRSNSRSLKAR